MDSKWMKGWRFFLILFVAYWVWQGVFALLRQPRPASHQPAPTVEHQPAPAPASVQSPQQAPAFQFDPTTARPVDEPSGK